MWLCLPIFNLSFIFLALLSDMWHFDFLCPSIKWLNRYCFLWLSMLTCFLIFITECSSSEDFSPLSESSLSLILKLFVSESSYELESDLDRDRESLSYLTSILRYLKVFLRRVSISLSMSDMPISDFWLFESRYGWPLKPGLLKSYKFSAIYPLF